MTALVIAKMPNFNPKNDGWTDLPAYRQLFKGCNFAVRLLELGVDHKRQW